MRPILLIVLIAIFECSVAAQQPDSAPSSSASQAVGPPTKSSSVNAVLQRYAAGDILGRYAAAYNHQNLDELLTIWPSAPNNKKQFRRIKDEFDRRTVSDMQVSIEVSEVKPLDNGDLLVHCTRDAQYKKLQTTSYSSGDLMMGATPVQNSGPSRLEEKKSIHDSREVWLTLHKTGNQWTIASISEKSIR